MTIYPTKFYVVHKLFTGAPFPKPVWGDIADGPLEHVRQVADCVLEAFKDAPEDMTRDNLRVWFLDGIRYHDMTDSAIAACEGRLERSA